MYAQVEKPKENRSKAVANSTAQKKGNMQHSFAILDNRPETVMQNCIQTICNGKRNVVLQQVNNNLAEAAESLSGKFLWTLPGGMLEYSTIIEHWKDYRNLLLENLNQESREKVRYISMGINNLLIIKSDGYIETCESMLNEIRLLITPQNEIEGMIMLKDEFTGWLHGGAIPKHLNCWEAVIFTCEKADIINKMQLLQYIDTRKAKNQRTDSEQLFRKFILGRSVENLIEADWEENIPEHEDPTRAQRGDILCFWGDGAIHHVAIYIAENKCMSIWAEDTLHFSETSVSGLLNKYDEPHLEIIRK